MQRQWQQKRTHQVMHLAEHIAKRHNFLAQYLHSMLLLLIKKPA
jgi:hypothetical protein